MSAALSERRSEIESRLEQLRREGGAAIVDGGVIDHESIAKLEAELGVLNEAEGLTASRSRAIAAEAEAERVERLRAQYSDANEHRLAAIARAERSARMMAEALRDCFAAIDRMQAAASAIPVRPSDKIGKLEMANRLSYRLSRVLQNIAHPGKFGALSLRPGPFPADTAWTTNEAVEPLQGEKKQ